MVHIGQSVKAGSPLFELSSSDYSEVVKNYIQSRTAMEVAKRVMDRTQDLYNNKVASERELDEAKMSYQMALEEYRHAAAVGKEFQIDLRTAEVGQPMVVRSPIAGKVLGNELVVGEYMKEDAEAKVVVADLDKVWVRANVSETAAPYVEGIEEVEVRLVSRPDSVVRGRVAYVGGLLDPETRTVQTIIECDNHGHRMLPNMYASVSMKMKEQNSIVVHKEAVLQGEGGRYVLRRVAENRYVRTPVKVQTLDEEHLLVTDGLKVGDEIIMDGAFYLIDCK
jgi:cobalt-zinc-cadmium efflux system membrane fusion protein